ncbi:MAG: hypothetical protein ACRC5S_03515 [Cetobacterium sp.]|uniref:hypothetical protein n=1 Tax=Cetobacterium somerae TaxID=188913 RepID=UPI002E7B00F9|nr:hypothetical protein [Cetobacterium somerae]WVJ03065.1 hypothetical protein VSU16_15145 [Cetobacterium somerae]
MKKNIFKKNQKVFDFIFGWGKIIKIVKDDYPVVVRFECGNIREYTSEGKLYKNEGNRRLFFSEIPIPDKAYKPTMWRARFNEEYFYVSTVGKVAKAKDVGDTIDDERHDVGNYFQTDDEVKESKYYIIYREKENV